MKKLITMMAAVALGAFAWADTDFDGTGSLTYTVSSDFEDGVTNIVGYADDAQTSVFDNGDVYWWVTNYPTTAAEKDTYEQPIEVATETINDTDVKVFKIETDSATPLLRTFNKTIGKDQDGDTVYTFDRAKQPIADNGLFADSMIKLSASEEPPATCNGKIAVWLQVIPEDTEAETEGSTNLMVTCGLVDNFYNVTGTTNIVISAEGVEIAPDTWHQVTIRTIKTIKDGKNVPGFVIWVDGQLATTEEDYELPAVEGKGARFNALNALFASASSDSGEATTLDSVGFSGSGALQKIDLLDAYHAPLFAVDQTYVRLAWDDKVTGVTIDGVALSDTDIGNKYYDYPVTNFTAAVSVALTLEDNPPYKVDTITTSTGFNVTDVADDKKTFKFTGAQTFDDSQTITIATVVDRTEAEVTINGGDATICNTLGQAFAAVRALASTKAAVSIKLLDNAQSDNFGFDSSLQFKTMEIDLNGHSITGTCATGYVFSNVGGLTISDTSDTGAGKIVAVNGYAIWNKGSLIINDATGAAPIEFVGEINNDTETQDEEGEVEIYGGKFTSINTLTPSEFVTLPEGKVWSEKTDTDGYYTIVDEDEPPTPTGTVIIITDDAGTITTNWFNSIAEAVTNAVNGDTITLLADQTLTAPVDIFGKAITLDGAFTVTAAGRAFNVRKGATFTIAAGTTVVGTGNGKNDTTIFLWPYSFDSRGLTDADADDYAKATLIVNGTVKYTGTAGVAAITQNGNDKIAGSDGVDIVINGTVTNTKDAALYLPGKGTCTVNTGAYIEGIFAGIQMKACALTVNGGTIKCTGDDATPTETWGNGANASGAAIQMECNSSYAAGSVTITGGTIESENGFALYAYGNDATKFNGWTITGGTIKGNAAKAAVLYIDALKDKIEGIAVPGNSTAAFSSDVSALCVTGFETVLDEQSGLYTVAAIPQFNVTFTKDNVEISGSGKTVYRDDVLAAGDIPEVTDEGAWDVNPTNAVITCTTNFNFTVKKEEPDVPVDDPTALDEDGKKNAAEVAAEIAKGGTDVNTWVATVYGEGGKIPAEKLNATTADNIALAVANDLPITVAKPTFEVSASTVTAESGNVAAFEFTLMDGTTPEQIIAITDKVKAMVRYTSNLATVPFDQATDAQVDIKASPVEGKIKAELKQTAANAGFMKVEPQQPTSAGL